MSGRSQLTQSELVVVFVVKYIHERREEWVKILMHKETGQLSVEGIVNWGRVTHVQHREVLQDSSQLFIERILGELDFPHVEITYPTDLEVFVDHLSRRDDIRFPSKI